MNISFVTQNILFGNEPILQDFISTNEPIFQTKGIDPDTCFPYDSLDEMGEPVRNTQPSAIGFYIQYLIDQKDEQKLSQVFKIAIT